MAKNNVKTTNNMLHCGTVGVMLKKNESPTLNNNQSPVCLKTINSQQEHLKHDILKHTSKKRKRNRSLERVCQITFDFLDSSEMWKERSLISESLHNCSQGMELQEIFKILCMDHNYIQSVFRRIQYSLTNELQLKYNQIYPFGSIVLQLALKDCDIDVYLDLSEKFKEKINANSKLHKIMFNRFYNKLRRSKHFRNVFALKNARVPIIKCTHNETNFDMDINLSCATSVTNTQFLASLLKSDERIYQLILFLKIWAKHMQIVKKGTMSCYCFIILVIFFLQQPFTKSNDEKYPPILLSIEKLQDSVKANYFDSRLDYAYDVCKNKKNRPVLHATITVVDLIIEFFHFYKNFNFTDYIIAPYLGMAILRKDFITGHIPYPAYHEQLRSLSHCTQKYVEPLKIDCCLCVQDPFNLTHNIAKSSPPNNLEYFQYCLLNASHICNIYKNSCNDNHERAMSTNKFFEALLYDLYLNPVDIDISTLLPNSDMNGNLKQNEKSKNNEDNAERECFVKQQEKIENNKSCKTDLDNADRISTNSTIRNDIVDSREFLAQTNYDYQNALKVVHIPSRNDLRALGSHRINGNRNKTNDFKDILKQWCKYYITAIELILSKVYRFHMVLQVNSKKLKLHNENDANEADDMSKIWYISNTFDLWTNRFHEKSSRQSFMQCQLEQTERLYNERYRNCNPSPEFVVDIKALLMVNVSSDYGRLEILLLLPDGSSPMKLLKKHPLKRFFNMFKFTLDNFNLNEAIQTSLFHNF